MKHSKLFSIVLLAALAVGCEGPPRFIVSGTFHIESKTPPSKLLGAPVPALPAEPDSAD